MKHRLHVGSYGANVDDVFIGLREFPIHSSEERLIERMRGFGYAKVQCYLC